MKTPNRALLFVLICTLLCICFTLSASASAAPIGDAVNDAIGDAVNDALNGAASTVTTGETSDIEGLLSDMGVTEDLLASFGDSLAVVLIVIAAIGLIVGLFGYRLFKLVLMLAGFACGWMIGYFSIDLAYSFGIFETGSLPDFVPIIVAFVLAIILCLLAVKLWAFGVFLSSAAGTFLLLSTLSAFDDLVDGIIAEDTEVKYILARILVAIIVGLLAVWLQKLLIILTTSAVGGSACGFSLASLLGMADDVSLPLCASLIIFVICVIVQFRAENKKKRKQKQNER